MMTTEELSSFCQEEWKDVSVSFIFTISKSVVITVCCITICSLTKLSTVTVSSGCFGLISRTLLFLQSSGLSRGFGTVEDTQMGCFCYQHEIRGKKMGFLNLGHFGRCVQRFVSSFSAASKEQQLLFLLSC